MALRTVFLEIPSFRDRPHRHLLGPVKPPDLRPVFHADHHSSWPDSTSQDPRARQDARGRAVPASRQYLAVRSGERLGEPHEVLQGASHLVAVGSAAQEKGAEPGQAT